MKLSFLKKIRVRWVVLGILLCFILVAMFSPEVGEWYVRKVYPFLSGILSRFSSLFPFSIGDCFIYGSIFFLLSYLVFSLVKRFYIKRTLRHIVEYLLWVYVWFYMAWGLTYFRQDFFTRTQLTPVTYSAEEFQSFLQAYTLALNEAYIPVNTFEKELVASEIKKEYRLIVDEFGLVSPKEYLRVKPMLISSLMSSGGVKGYMGPFFTEFNLSRDLLPFEYPSTYAHEMAHVLGVSNEAEANLYSYLVCTKSDIPEIRFAGYFSLFPYVVRNTRMLLDEDAYEAWKGILRPEVIALYQKRIEYWSSLYSPFLGEIQDVVYNVFLKGNNIPTGTANYSEVIALLISLNKKPSN